MTVAELIKILSTYDPNAEVRIDRQDDSYCSGTYELTGVWREDSDIIFG